MKEEPIVKLNGTEFSPSEGETLKQQVLRYFMSQGGEANCSFGKVKLDNKGIKNDIAHPNYLNKTHAFAAIKDVLEKGKITTPFDYHEVHGKKQPTGIISGYIMIAEQPFKMDVTVIGNAGGELRLYCHDVYPIPIIENHQKSIITNYVLEKSKRQLSRNSFGDGTKITKIIESKKYKNMKKNIQRINESQLRAIVAESVKRVLNEVRCGYANGTYPSPYYLCEYGGTIGSPTVFVWRTMPLQDGFRDAEKVKMSPEFETKDAAIQWAKEESEKWIQSINNYLAEDND